MIARFVRHLIGEDFALRRAFPRAVRARIAAAIAEQERRHTGELRFVIEGGLAPGQLLRGQTARERAVELFARLGVWDTAANNGVLVYVLLADRAVEIVADRGIHARVGAQAWEVICGEMQRRFAARRFEEGALAGLQAAGDLLATHFPAAPGSVNPDELPNEPLLL
ncbi:MAG: hypothetical protein FJY55_06975 [Betaproteobacteria bacterium]|nr:hypothetical protein [Betaproteobacteria bacterium]